MNYKKITADDIAWFKTVLGEEAVFADADTIEKYSKDETDGVKFPPEVVLKPFSVEQVSAIMKYCYEHVIPVSPRAGGTGLQPIVCVYTVV